MKHLTPIAIRQAQVFLTEGISFEDISKTLGYATNDIKRDLRVLTTYSKTDIRRKISKMKQSGLLDEEIKKDLNLPMDTIKKYTGTAYEGVENEFLGGLRFLNYEDLSFEEQVIFNRL